MHGRVIIKQENTNPTSFVYTSDLSPGKYKRFIKRKEDIIGKETWVKV